MIVKKLSKATFCHLSYSTVTHHIVLSKFNVIMSKKVCICGRDATKNKPLVITITTCKNKHSGLTDNSKLCPPDHQSSPGGSDGRPSSAKGGSNHSLSKTNRTGNTSFHETADSPTLDKSHANSSRSALKKGSATKVEHLPNRQLSFSNKDTAHIISDNEDNQQENSPTSEDEADEDSEEPASELLGLNNNVELHAHHSYFDETTLIDRNGSSGSTDITTRVSFPNVVFSDTAPHQPPSQKSLTKPAIRFTEPVSAGIISKPHIVMKPPRSVVVQTIGRTKDKMFNFPSDVALKLPVLVSRHHGHGCAMEINVMEKHSKNCKYKKLKNSSRNPVDDKVGSYEVIGRIIYKTCQVGNFNINNLTEKETSSMPQLGKLISLLNYSTVDQKNINTSTGERQVDSLNDLLNGLVKSSKSYPADISSTVDYIKKSNSAVGNYWLNSKKCDVEEIFFSGKKCDKSVQKPKGQHKKWYSFLFPCVFMDN